MICGFLVPFVNSTIESENKQFSSILKTSLHSVMIPLIVQTAFFSDTVNQSFFDSCILNRHVMKFHAGP